MGLFFKYAKDFGFVFDSVSTTWSARQEINTQEINPWEYIVWVNLLRYFGDQTKDGMLFRKSHL